MKRSVAKKKSQKPPKPTQRTDPVPTRTTAVPRSLGEGEVRLYDAHKAGLPDLAMPPPKQQLVEFSWVLVHFPSRRCVVVPEGRLEAFRVLKALERGKDLLKLLPAKPKVRLAGTRTRAGAGAREVDKGVDEEKEPEGPRREAALDLPDVSGLNFDAAMKTAFPNEFIIRELGRLLRAQKPIVDKEGNLVDYSDDYMTQTNAVKLMIEHAQGRAGEKPPPPPEKKKVTFEELAAQIKTSKSARDFLRRLMDEAEQEAVKKSAPEASAVPPGVEK